MKFIKTLYGYINPQHITDLTVKTEYNKTGEKFFQVVAHLPGTDSNYGFRPTCTLGNFTVKEQAQNWLDKIVKQINEDSDQ